MVHELDTSDEEMPPNDRHRVTPAPLRWVVLRMGAGSPVPVGEALSATASGVSLAD